MADIKRAQSEVEHYSKELKRVTEELVYWTKELRNIAEEEQSKADRAAR